MIAMGQYDRFTIRRLEQALCASEQQYWAMSVLSTGYAIAGEKPPVRGLAPGGLLSNHAALREHLLSLRTMNDFDYERFAFAEAPSRGFTLNELFPMMLGWWCVDSRRVYHIDRDLQALLMATKLDDLRWEDLHFPFDSFGISLEVPVNSKGKGCDFILISPVNSRIFRLPAIGDGKIFCLAEFDCALERWKPYTLRGTVERHLRKGNVGGAMQRITDDRVVERSSGFIYGSFLHKGKRSVLETLRELEESSDDEHQDHLLWRIVAGLCVYRRMRHVEPYISDWKRLVRTKVRNTSWSGSGAVTDGSEICVVRARRQLSDVERKLLFGIAMGKLKGYELECHFREGHYRRPPGKGHDPDFPQTVIVDPTIVRPDRWPTNGLPIGLEKILASY